MLLTGIICWPQGYGVLWLVLCPVMVYDGIRSQKNIALCQGQITLKEGNLLLWQNQEWCIVRQPWMIRQGVLLLLGQIESNTRRSFWLASDSMTEHEWRHLCQLLRQSAHVNSDSQV